LIRLVGTCPVCERQQKVTPQHRMVHHGYRRPGVGHIFGDCPGVGWPAYEISSEGCVAYREGLKETRSLREEALRLLRMRPEKIDVYSSFSKKYNTYRRDPEDRNESYNYEQALRNRIAEIEYEIRAIDAALLRMTELIERWAPAPLVEIDEEGLTPARREERAARKTERDTKRAERLEKQAATRAKQNERMARKATTLLFFFNEFERLAALPPSKARADYARDLMFEANKTKHKINYPWDLHAMKFEIPGPWQQLHARAQRTLVALGLARPWEHGNGIEVLQVYRPCGNKIVVPSLDRPAGEVLDDIAHMPPPRE